MEDAEVVRFAMVLLDQRLVVINRLTGSTGRLGALSAWLNHDE